MNPFSSHLPPVFSHENHYNLDYPLMSQLNFPVITHPQSAHESFINGMEPSSCNPMFIMNDDHHHFLEQKTPNVFSGRGKKPIRKDKHSKIYTASGPRDRRVRLSIGIAREFFDLHDMLGFDKASKTLEWLLKKSRYAIQELAESKKDSVHKDGDEHEHEHVDGNDQDKRFGSDSNSEYCEEAMGLDASKCESGNHEEDSRGRIDNRKLKESMHFPENITQSQLLRKTMCTVRRRFEDDETLPRATEDVNEEEPIFIKQKPKPWPIPSRDFSFNNNNINNNNDITNLSRDWNSNRHDMFADSSAYPSITNMNSSQQDDIGNIGFHIYGKPW